MSNPGQFTALVRLSAQISLETVDIAQSAALDLVNGLGSEVEH